jgi:hypothetical protein
VSRPLPLLSVSVVAAVAATLLASCGSSGHTSAPTIQRALVTQLSGFRPAAPVQAGKPVKISFRILQPSGSKLVTMTRFRRGSGPHTGVHLIIVRDDLGVIIHRHPPIGADGVFRDTVVFPKPGPYRVVLDVYPATGPQPNFQLIDQRIRVLGAYEPQPLPKPVHAETVGGYHVKILKITPSPLRAIESALISVTVTDPQGKPVAFTPWYGALAHAIFFHAGRFEYFHTHVCSPGAGGCTSLILGNKVSGSSATPGRMTVGVILPDSGTWQLFLQFLGAHGKVVTAPFTLRVNG